MATINLNGTYYAFTITAANATVGATYTNNGVTYTVNKTIAGATTLVCTATLGSTTSGTTLTKTSGTGDATITFSSVSLEIPINSFTWASADSIVVSAGNYLLVNQTPSGLLGTVQSIAASKVSGIKFVNTSTTTPIVISMSTQTSDIYATYASNSITASGDWIKIATGNGTASQTIDFTSVMGGAIDWPSVVWVETFDSRHYSITPSLDGVQGYFMPFFNCGLGTGTNVAPDYDVMALNILTHCYGDIDNGPVFQYNATTKIATFGKGGAIGSSLGGAVIPNGARVLFPNIHFTSSVFDTVEGNRNQLYLTSGATCNIDKVSFSRNFWTMSSGGFYDAGNTSMSNVGITGRFSSNNCNGTMSYTNIAIAPFTSQALTTTTNVNLGANLGDTYINYLWSFSKTSATYSPSVQLSSSTSMKEFKNIWSWQYNTQQNGSYPVLIDTVSNSGDNPVPFGPIYSIGGIYYMLRSDNIHVSEVYQSDRCDGVLQTTVSLNAIALGYCKNVSIAKLRSFSTGSAPRGVLISIDSTCKQCAVKDVIYEGESNLGSIGSIAGERVYLSNAYVTNIRTGGINAALAKKQCRVSNIISSNIQSISSIPNGEYVEWQTNSNASGYIGNVVFDAEPFNPYWSNSSKSAGFINIGPVTIDQLDQHMTTVSGVYGTDFWISGAYFYCPGICEVIFTNRWPIRGVTNFSGAAWSWTHTGMTTNASVEFSLRNNDDTSSWGSWYDITTSANWQTALSALSGYTSTKGFFARVRFVTTSPYTSYTRSFNYGKISCTPDSSWTPAEIGFIPLSVTQAISGSTIKLYENDVPASPINVITKTIATSEVLDLPYNFDATAKPYRLKVRKSGYGELDLTGSSYQKGVGIPLAQIQYTVIDDAVASLITGVSVNGATNTVTITGNNTYQDIHQYLQWWSVQIANMGYAVPSVTSDNINYTSTYNFVVNTGVNISGTGALTLTGGATLTMTGTAKSTIDITHTSGTKVWTRIKLTNLVSGSTVQLYDTNTSTELYNAVVSGTSLEYQTNWTADHTIRYRVAYMSGLTAKNFIDSNGTFTSSGMNIQISQTDDKVYIANAINGSTVTGITISAGSSTENINLAGGSVTWGYIYAYQVYWQATSIGIAAETAFISAPDTAHYYLTGFKIRNVNAVPLSITGGIGVDSTTGRTKDCIDYAGSTGNIYVEPNSVEPYNANTSDLLTFDDFMALK